MWKHYTEDAVKAFELNKNKQIGDKFTEIDGEIDKNSRILKINKDEKILLVKNKEEENILIDAENKIVYYF